MAFLADDEMAAFEAALSFVDEFADGRAHTALRGAENERRIEVAYLREKVAQVEAELESLQQHQSSTKLIKQDGHDDSTSGQDGAMVPSLVTEQSAWKPVAQQQRKRREMAEIDNARLKLVLESQLKAAKSIQMLLLKGGLAAEWIIYRTDQV
ncbi:hypothetical protein PC110_g23199 [Phytophthora cactorum]|uniref:Uncharacterized protein n=1 Tax=Phytophthora cactorum TaxID=29920 RepID=A0A329R8R0_9STRA|nr:hypothetical protein PC115_g23812 [Phytophthora cactorum]KAG2960605.1 hypothetical protein PC119_g26343 [Phytophthora cactorum]KAG3124905.1 hypothetical protein C6341_g25994 [Phytophthora cactorum]RAW20359.1 hypothetical protein PC110_g23199 [Phytophthora cactorum]